MYSTYPNRYPRRRVRGPARTSGERPNARARERETAEKSPHSIRGLASQTYQSDAVERVTERSEAALRTGGEHNNPIPISCSLVRLPLEKYMYTHKYDTMQWGITLASRPALLPIAWHCLA